MIYMPIGPIYGDGSWWKRKFVARFRSCSMTGLFAFHDPKIFRIRISRWAIECDDHAVGAMMVSPFRHLCQWLGLVRCVLSRC